MNELKLWLVVGCTFGALLGSFFTGFRGFVFGSVTGSGAGALFVIISTIAARKLGGTLGWILAGPIGLSLGGMLLLVSIGKMEDAAYLARIGVVGGGTAGLAFGSICGLLNFITEMREDRHTVISFGKYLVTALVLVVEWQGNRMTLSDKMR